MKFLSVYLAIILLTNQTTHGNINHRIPILILATDANFGSYTSEILRTEGFNVFIIDSITSANFTSAFLKKFDVVILTRTDLSQRQQELISSYVKDGGSLIAF